MTANLIHVVTAAVVCAFAFAVPVAAEPVTETKPVKLKSFMRKPVATSATRTVKQTNGDYAKVAVKRRSKTRVAAVTRPSPPAETLSPAAAQAFASYELARVRVVTPEEADGARRLADAAINANTLVSVDTVQIVNAKDVNDLDRRADSPIAISLDSLSRDLAGSRSLTTPAEPRADAESWLQRLLVVFGSAFTAVAALVRTLLG